MSLIFKPFQSTLANKEGKKNWYPRVIRIAKPVTTYERPKTWPSCLP